MVTFQLKAPPGFSLYWGKNKKKTTTNFHLGVRADYSTGVILFFSFVILDIVTDLCGFEKAQKTPSVVFSCAPSALQRKQRTTASLWIKSSLISVIMEFSHYMINLSFFTFVQLCCFLQLFQSFDKSICKEEWVKSK